MTQTADPHSAPVAVTADEPELTGPVRLCALTRTEQKIEDLIRFGAGLDGVVVPDLALRLPGRGVWVTASRAAVELAVRRNVFAKSMKRNVAASADLPERIDALLQKRVLEAFSIANKAGLVIPGFAKVEEALETGAVVGLFHGKDGAADGTERLNRKFNAISAARDYVGLIVSELTIEQISLAIGRSNVVHAAIISGGAAARLLDEARRLARYRASPDAS
ncbi:MAG: RNA-binding protein [Hyphomicrobiaceae bacterium]